MKTQSQITVLWFGRLAAAFAFALSSVSTLARAAGDASDSHSATQSNSAPENHRARDRVQIAPPDAGSYGLRQLVGQPVRSADHKDLGTLEDFIIVAKSGRAAYAVVSTLGIMDATTTLHVIPTSTLHPSAPSGFATSFPIAQWSQAPELNKERFDQGGIALSDAGRKHLEQLGARGATAETAADLLVRASSIRDKQIRAGQDGVAGVIDDVIVDLRNGQARALVSPDQKFVPPNRKFLVSLSALQITAPDQDPLPAELTRSDFQHAAIARLTREGEEPGAPTGRPTSTAPNAEPRR